MKTVGRILNEKEIQKVKNPYTENSGPKWDLDRVREIIDQGLDEIEKDEELRKVLLHYDLTEKSRAFLN